MHTLLVLHGEIKRMLPANLTDSESLPTGDKSKSQGVSLDDCLKAHPLMTKLTIGRVALYWCSQAQMVRLRTASKMYFSPDDLVQS